MLYSVPYSPQLNPIEEFFNQFKHYIRRKKPQNLDELKKAIDFSFDEIRKKGCCVNYFLHAFNTSSNIKKRKHKLRPQKKYKED